MADGPTPMVEDPPPQTAPPPASSNPSNPTNPENQPNPTNPTIPTAPLSESKPPAPPTQEPAAAQEPPKPPALENTEATKNAQKAAFNIHAKVNTQALSVRQYLEATVVPVLMQGLQSLVRERPEDPVEYLAAYLLKNKPAKKEGKTEEVKAEEGKTGEEKGTA